MSYAYVVGTTPSPQITFNEQTVVAYFDWGLCNHLGSIIRGSDRTAMADFVSRGSTDKSVTPQHGQIYSTHTGFISARQFQTVTNGRETFEWRRLGNRQPYAYEVCLSPLRAIHGIAHFVL